MVLRKFKTAVLLWNMASIVIIYCPQIQMQFQRKCQLPLQLAIDQLVVMSMPVTKNVVTYNAALGACEKAHLWEQALQFLASMTASHIQKDASTFPTAISALSKSAQWQRALRLFWCLL